MTVACFGHVRRTASRGSDGLARRRLLRLALSVTTAALVAAPARSGWAATPSQAASDAKGFVETLGAEVLSIVKAPNLSQGQRREKFRELFSTNFDVPTIARFVVGRYWNRASSADQQAYVDTFRNYVAAIYADQFSNYRGEGFKTLGARSLGDDESLVRSEIERPNQPPINVAFRVSGASGSFKITDVTVENVSLIITKRDEFSSILEQGGLKGVTDRMQAILNNNAQHAAQNG